jgi:tRNA (cytosine38-C5)-methyltransferase
MAITPFKVAEFFCGIGGLRYSLEWARLPAEVVAAFDIGVHTNQCYAANFGGHKPTASAIERLSASSLDALDADCWLLSPPCQPYKRGGLKKDADDPRSAGLLNLTARLLEMKKPPRTMLLENVVGFEDSKCRAMLVDNLHKLSYGIAEFILSPLDFGLPNDRQRYFLCARKNAEGTPRPSQSYLERNPPIYRTCPPFSDNTARPDITPLSAFLSENPEDERYLVPAKWLLPRHGFKFDLVNPTDRKSSAFTANYATHYVIGTGSYLNHSDLPFDFAEPETLLPLKLRHFSPVEIARLHRFPVDAIPEGGQGFVFPEDLSERSKYRAIGNSLNVEVVGTLLKNVLFGDEEGKLFS